ncbi:hypothetical protein DITRI_Ditri15bG0050300 [Diplodiscus trichospermus]
MTLHFFISLILPSLLLFSSPVSIVLSFSPSQTYLQKQCLENQRSALLQLHRGLYHSPNFTFSSQVELWDLNTDCCSCKGITCDALGHVIGVDLSYKSLSGNFHSIFHLHHLQRLNLAGNNFNTSLFQYEFDRLSNLTHLNLSNSCFHGQIPVKISYLTRLVSLDLSNQHSCFLRHNNQIFGPLKEYDTILANIPIFPNDLEQPLKLENPNFKTLIKNLRSLVELYLDSVNISTQSTKWCETISLVLPNLRVLSLSNCGLTGSFCSPLSRLHFLSELFLDGNPISYLPPNFLEISSRLVSLSLRNCNLSGHFPTEVLSLPKMRSIDISDNNHLMGQLPEFPLNSDLRSLWFSNTSFSGELPESIGNLKFLTNLNLHGCYFSGKIPSSIANLTNLVELDLGFNYFSGLIPPFHIFGVPSLSRIYLGWNQLSGTIHSSLFTLPSLETLSLGQNQLVGEIGEFPNASSSLLKNLYLSFNYLRGSIPKSILQLPRLERLFIANNSFSSMKLEIFFQLKNLKGLQLSNISLSIEKNNRSLGLPQLEYLLLSSCNLTEFPEFIKTQDRLIYLDLSRNQIHGFMPNWLWKTSLLVLSLSSNAIDFPKEFQFGDANFSFPMLRLLRLQSCNISAFPPILKSLNNLEYIDLSNNRISGAVPNWVWKKSLHYLDLSNNSLSSLGQFSLNHSSTSSQAPQLKSLKISNNKLEGKLPRSLANCKKLQVLEAEKNMIHDTFPFWLMKLPFLKVLVLRENRFFGTIKFSEYENAFPMLHILDLASNNFSGELSVGFIQSLKAMRMMFDHNKAKPDYIGDDYYLDSVTITNKGFEIFYPRILTTLTCLDFSNNSFHGRIPEEIENLNSLKMLNFSYNKFLGPIPLALGNLNELESLDLSHNKLSGKIPQQLTSLTFLGVLNLSYNQLEGSIPQSNQFGTFSNDSYIGNPRLCGLPLIRKCNEVGSRMPTLKEDEDSWVDGLFDWKIVLMGYGCGLVIGLCIGYTVLNELGNKWLDSFARKWNRKRRRSR